MRDAAPTQAGELSYLKLGLALGLLSALGPFSIDLYLPAFPHIARDLAASPGDVQRTLSVFFLALAFAQIPVGALGDRYGRKMQLYLGLGLYVVASLACAGMNSIGALIVLRFVQGFGVCAGTAVSRAMIRDLKTGHEAARLMAASFLVIGISPIVAPLFGSFLLTVVSWRGLFIVLAAFGLAGLVVSWLLPNPCRRSDAGRAAPRCGRPMPPCSRIGAFSPPPRWQAWRPPFPSPMSRRRPLFSRASSI